MNLTALMLEEARWERAALALAVLRERCDDKAIRKSLKVSARVVNKQWRRARADLRAGTNTNLWLAGSGAA